MVYQLLISIRHNELQRDLPLHHRVREHPLFLPPSLQGRRRSTPVEFAGAKKVSTPFIYFCEQKGYWTVKRRLPG